jgi:hypothetical protein
MAAVESSSDTRGLHTLRTTTTRAAPTAHRAEYLCYWFSFSNSPDDGQTRLKHVEHPQQLQ